MQRYKIEYERFGQMRSDIEMALYYLENNETNSAMTHLRFCLITMETEQECYGKEMPIDKFRKSQQALTA